MRKAGFRISSFYKPVICKKLFILELYGKDEECTIKTQKQTR